MTLFVRQIGNQPGVQLNPLKDNSELPSSGNQDQVFAIAARFPRGRIDKPFRVNRSNAARKLGNAEPMRVSALNEAHVQTVEALNKGAYEAVVMRLSTASASLSWIVVNADGTATTSLTAPSTGAYLFAVRHLECFNDGIKVAFHADTVVASGVNVANTAITLRILDKSDLKLYEVYGSLDPNAVDDYGKTLYLPNVLSTALPGGEVEMVVNTAATVATTSPGYGKDSNGGDAYASTGLVSYFVEGGTGYTTADYMRARVALRDSNFDFGYIASGGSQASAMLVQLSQLAYETNRRVSRILCKRRLS